jgi:thymidylate kinase
MADPEQHVATSGRRRPCMVSFSGIDGSGKTTQIDALTAWLNAAGLRVRIVRFWDDIAVLVQLRQGASHKIFKSEEGVGSPERPVRRRDKNVRGWYMSLVRLFLYGLDAVHLSWRFAGLSKCDADAVIFDRCLYDEFANLKLEDPFVAFYIRMLLKLIPHPDVAFLLDANPEHAVARKPEYPVTFLQENRSNYLALAKITPGMAVIPPCPVEEVTRIVLQQVSTAVLRTQADSLSQGPSCADNLTSS